MYPTVTEVTKTKKIALLKGGVHKVLLTNINGKQIVYKLFEIPKPDTKSKVKEFIKDVFDTPHKYFLQQLPDHKYSDLTLPHNPDLEIKVLNEWKKHNIPTIQFVEKQENALLTEYIEAEHYLELLKSEDYMYKPVDSLIKTIKNIRNVAKAENNKKIYHPDPRLNNYIYNFESKIALAVDPGGKINTQFSIDKIDSQFLLSTIYSFLKTNPKNKFSYIEQFASEFSREDRIKLAKDNHQINKISEKYFNIRSKVKNLFSEEKSESIANTYSRKNTRTINEILLSNNL